MKTRIMKGKILLWKGIQEGNNELLKYITNRNRVKLNDEVGKFSQKIGISKEDMLSNNKNAIKEKIRNWDEEEWKAENYSKSTLCIYNKYRTTIKEQTYFNENKSLLMYRFRSNTLKLNDQKRHQNGDIKCPLCEYEIEDIEHFMLNCTKIEEERQKIMQLQRPRIENTKEIIGSLIFQCNSETETKLYKMWNRRMKLMEES